MVPSFPRIQTILVPQGAEYQAVCQGLSDVTADKPAVLAIPVGTKSVTQHLEAWQQKNQLSSQSQPQVLVMGLCGSLNPNYGIGDMVLYQECIDAAQKSEPRMQLCDRHLTEQLYSHLPAKVSLVKALTSNHIIHTATEKRNLAQTYRADVVDMEGFAVLKVLSQTGVAVAMLRVISDDCQHNLPDLTASLSPEGKLQTLPLAIAMIRQPIAATRLIRGALRGLKVLQNATKILFSSY